MHAPDQSVYKMQTVANATFLKPQRFMIHFLRKLSSLMHGSLPSFSSFPTSSVSGLLSGPMLL